MRISSQKRARCEAGNRRLRSNRSVDADTLRQGAAQCRWKSCTVRPLAATCRSPLRYTGAVRPRPPHGGCELQRLRLLLAASSAGSSRPRPDLASRTAADWRRKDVRAHSWTLCPRRAAPTLSIVASPAGLALPLTAWQFVGCRFRSPRAQLGHAAVGRAEVDAALQVVGTRSRHNGPVDADALRQGAAQRRGTACAARPLAATRRSPSR